MVQNSFLVTGATIVCKVSRFYQQYDNKSILSWLDVNALQYSTVKRQHCTAECTKAKGVARVLPRGNTPTASVFTERLPVQYQFWHKESKRWTLNLWCRWVRHDMILLSLHLFSFPFTLKLIQLTHTHKHA
jgi:hypothetical protein